MIKPQNLLPNLSPRQPLEDEYISETDGLIYCSKCHTPRQKKIEFLGKIMFPIIRCQCQQEQYEKEEAKRKHQEFLEHISRLKSSGLQDPALREFTFAHDNGINPEIEKAKNYVTHWEEIKSKAMGLLLWGDVGTGKSFFAGCVANALLDKGVGKYYDYHRRDIAANEVDYLNVEDPDVFSHRAWELEYQRKQEIRRNQPARTKKRSYDMEL